MSWTDEKYKSLEAFEENSFKVKKYRLKQLKKMISHLDAHASYCESCEKYQDSIDRMIEFINDPLQYDEYLCLFNLVLDHLAYKHKFCKAWHHCMVIVISGGLIGFLLSYVLKSSYPISIAMGCFIGASLGLVREFQLNKSGKRI